MTVSCSERAPYHHDIDEYIKGPLIPRFLDSGLEYLITLLSIAYFLSTVLLHVPVKRLVIVRHGGSDKLRHFSNYNELSVDIPFLNIALLIVTGEKPGNWSTC